MSFSEKPGSAAEELENLELNLIAGLKEKGIDDSGVRALLIEWIVLQESEVDAQGGTTEVKVEFELRRARLYRSAGFLDDARTASEDALTIARNEGRKDLCGKINVEMNC